MALIAHFTGLIDHVLNLLRMQCVEYLEEEVAFGKFTIVLWEVVPHVLPIPNLTIHVLDGQPGPVRHGLGWHLLLSQAFFLTIKDGLQKDEFTFGCFRQ